MSEEINKCVHCGFCLESCPTYVVTRSEVHSPRGRIMIAKLGLESEGIYTCMFCRRCEEACPSGVVFSKIMSSYRKPKYMEKMSYRVLETPYLLYLLLRFSNYSRNQIVSRLREFATSINKPLEYINQNAEVILFPGCITSVLFRHVVEKAFKFLSKRFKVTILNTCCGLAHYSGGDTKRAEEIRFKLREYFRNKRVILLSSNCAAYLKENSFSNVFDFSEFLIKENLIDNAKKKELEVTVHYPCHAHLLGLSKYIREGVERLVSRVKEMEDPSFECGAGGDRFIFSQDISDLVSTEKKRKIGKSGATTVISTNPVCSLAILKMGYNVIHIAELLD
ncbi:MAG: (Fe-S)-binding protein [Sulfolobaceae archaeon]